MYSMYSYCIRYTNITGGGGGGVMGESGTGVVVFTDATHGRQLIDIMHGIVYWGYMYMCTLQLSCCNLFSSFRIECDDRPSSSLDPLH